MFTLRKVSSNGIASNQYIGDEYTIIRKSSNEAEFNKILKQNFNFNSQIYGFVKYGSSAFIIPLYDGSRYFIMSSNGNTFESLRP